MWLSTICWMAIWDLKLLFTISNSSVTTNCTMHFGILLSVFVSLRSWLVGVRCTMDKISDLALKSQTVCGAVHFVLFLVSWPTIISLLQGLHSTDRLNFSCKPKPSDVTRKLCYGDYISAVSPLLIPLNFALIICGILGLFWVVYILYSVLALRRINEERNSDEKKCLSKQFMWKFLLHVCVQLAVLSVMMGLFCGFQTLHLPVVYMCSHGNTTQIPTSQLTVNMACNDLHHRQKSKLNIGIVTIMAISIVLCLVSIIHLFFTRKDFLKQLLGDQESAGNPEEIPLGELLEVIKIYLRSVKATLKSWGSP